jgi:DNA-binding transcriptional regulator GbsR (MarR family)
LLKIENRKEHYLKAFEDVTMEFRKSKRGRKRKNYLQAKNMYEFLQLQFLPEWKLALDQHSSRERELQVYQHDMKFVWVQFFKDVRRFYRIMFRLRFHR